jgi:allophanate hydrolase
VADALFRVITAGPLSTVQDGGRPGFARFGVSAGGPMDRTSHRIGQSALGDIAEGTALEIDLQGLTLECLDGAADFALTGGDFSVAFGNASETGWVTNSICAGERMTIRPHRWGNWCYVAFSGVIDTPKWLGSRSVNPSLNVTGRRLVAGDVLRVVNVTAPNKPARRLPVPVFARPRPEIRFVAGPQERFFTEEAFGRFLGETFATSTRYNRQGIRLDGPALSISTALDMPSEPLARGSVQVDGSGQASVLMADHQPTGGYPKIGTVISGDQDRLAQLRPRSQFRFIETSPQAAIKMLRRRDLLIHSYLAALRS